MNFEKLDRIHITEPELKQLMMWKDLNKDLVRNFKVVLKEGIILVDGHNSVIYFKYEDSMFEFRYYFLNQLGLRFRFGKYTGLVLDREVNESSHLIRELIGNAKMTTNEFAEGFTKDIITVVATIMAYMENYQPNVVEKRERIKKSGVGGNSKKGKKNKIRINRTAYVVTVKAEDLVSTAKKVYTRSAEAWTVKGHARHYKSGKVVWIKPYTKGIERGEVQPKTYVFN